MYLRRIEVFGFKSFPQKLVLELGPGISSVVGPNGCGKSNIADAVRWALGEHNVRHLRGKLLEDLIFNGSQGREPLGMAEVTLTFADAHAPSGLTLTAFINRDDDKMLGFVVTAAPSSGQTTGWFVASKEQEGHSPPTLAMVRKGERVF